MSKNAETKVNKPKRKITDLIEIKPFSEIDPTRVAVVAGAGLNI